MSNASKNDSVDGSANKSNLIVNKIDKDKTLTKIRRKKWKRFVWSKNKQGLIKAFKNKRDYVRICKILARVSGCFALMKKSPLNGWMISENQNFL